MTAKKVYAVARGRAVGIFTSWSECEKQVKGFAGARFQSFTDINAALAWLSGTKDTPAQKKAAPKAVSPADYTIFTDGSCLRNPGGPGGWAMVAKDMATGQVTERSAGEPSTTNNRMELTAAIEALRYAPEGTRVASQAGNAAAGEKPTASPCSTRSSGWSSTGSMPHIPLTSTGSRDMRATRSTNGAIRSRNKRRWRQDEPAQKNLRRTCFADFFACMDLLNRCRLAHDVVSLVVCFSKAVDARFTHGSRTNSCAILRRFEFLAERCDE